jgi:hypothetical protein
VSARRTVAPPAGGGAAPRPVAPAGRDLAKRVRASKALTAAQRRYWLAVLPYLEPADRARLDAILGGAAPDGG